MARVRMIFLDSSVRKVRVRRILLLTCSIIVYQRSAVIKEIRWLGSPVHMLQPSPNREHEMVVLVVDWPDPNSTLRVREAKRTTLG